MDVCNVYMVLPSIRIRIVRNLISLSLAFWSRSLFVNKNKHTISTLCCLFDFSPFIRRLFLSSFASFLLCSYFLMHFLLDSMLLYIILAVAWIDGDFLLFCLRFFFEHMKDSSLILRQMPFSVCHSMLVRSPPPHPTSSFRPFYSYAMFSFRFMSSNWGGFSYSSQIYFSHKNAFHVAHFFVAKRPNVLFCSSVS